MALRFQFSMGSLALLTIMIAHMYGQEAGELIPIMGDAHVYSDHADTLKGQFERDPKEFHTLMINRQVDDIDDSKFECFELLGYDPRPSNQMNMSV
ncbi:unnamed protein product [Tuber melanosporum]|uniref:(Perigord truffle) hypothetical protein n=1 Tax=Tuber melanosporum (strain Mel28) TaxID=656061 RepID=D5GCZ2_TUBMM|nr:uncharacterized protein GSTUM_00006014001 [Tuber melanosporum]CAZ82385.1 unnamed protein product [Tuber melanosporum]